MEVMCSCQHLSLVVRGNLSYRYDYLDIALIRLSMDLDHHIFTAESALKYSQLLVVIIVNISLNFRRVWWSYLTTLTNYQQLCLNL